MPTIVTAKSGDCLCGIAVDHGFIDCKPLRDLADNAPFLNRDLRDGDQITVPDLAVEEFSKSVDAKHTFTIKSSPPFNIRFVHGSPNLPYRDDTTTPVLNVSNFVTNLGGSTGTAAFPKAFGFNQDGHVDLDSFKVEVWDPSAGGSVNVKLEALKPVYTADPSGKLTATSFVEFGDAKRRIDSLVCNQVSATSANTYRSKYMRLVVDEDDRDKAGINDQVLFVSDMADGLGTGGAADNDTVEILDQLVRATYVIQRCPGSPKCKVTTVAPIGGDERLRVRLHFYILRNAVGVDQVPGGVSVDDARKQLRHRIFKWYRRVFAQANIGPKVLSINVLDPPEENMLCLSHSHGRTARAGVNFSCDIKAGSDAPIPFALALQDGETPVDFGNRIVANLPAGFSGQTFATPRVPTASRSSCDVLITSADGKRVTILNPAIPAAGRMTVAVPRIKLNSVSDTPDDGSLAFLTTETKRLLHMAPISDDALHCILVGDFVSGNLLGQAYSPCRKTAAAFRPDLPYRSATIMARTNAQGGVLDGGNTFPMVSQHESTHILTDLIHTATGSRNELNQLMATFAQLGNSVDGPKRICGGPFHVTMVQNLTTSSVNVQAILVDEIRRNGADKMEAW